MSKILEEVIQANAAYAASFGDKSKLTIPPARRFAILTCRRPHPIHASWPDCAGNAHVILA